MSTLSQSPDRNTVSHNFAVAKLASILLVMTGHYFERSILWVPVTVALFIFAFSSGFFSESKYESGINIKQYWLAKFRRLLPPLLVINSFLLILFLFQGKTNIFSFHSVLGWLGLTGILDWLGIQNQSPYGHGLWFFTVLLMFYLFYPFLSLACGTRKRAHVFVVVSIFACILGQLYAAPPYMLWPTVFGFLFGVYAGKISWRTRWVPSLLGITACVALFLTMNYLGYKQLNILSLALLSIASTALLISLPMRLQLGVISKFMPCIIEIYLVHTYLFIRIESWPAGASFAVSILLVGAVSLCLYHFRTWLFSYSR